MTEHPIDTEALRRITDQATPGPWPLFSGGEYVGGVGILVAPDDGGVSPANAAFIAAARTAVPALLDALAAAEHRATRAESERDEWRQTALDERAAALDALDQIKVRDARAADIWDEGWSQGMAYVTGMERGTDDDDLDHTITNPYRASEGK